MKLLKRATTMPNFSPVADSFPSRMGNSNRLLRKNIFARF